jgi:uncharacterized membrane protein
MWLYAQRLQRDLVRWRDAGLITAASEAAIRADIAARSHGPGLSGVLGLLGAVLLGFAAMSFVAANWQEMSRLARVGLLLAGLWASYGAAGVLVQRNLPGFANAAVLLGTALFGASIMLIAQMYHIDGNPPDAVLTWGAGALLAGVALRSNPALGLAMLLVALWSGWQTTLLDGVHWAFLLGWAAVAAAIAWRRWSGGLHLAATVLAGWVIGLGYLLNEGHAHPLVVGLGVAVAAAGLAAEQVPDLRRYTAALIGYGSTVAFAGLFALQFIDRTTTGEQVLYGVLTLAGVLAAILWGARSGHRGMLWLGYAGFSIWVLAIYFKTIGTLLGSSLFFLATGVLVIGLAWLAYRLHEGQGPAREVAP